MHAAAADQAAPGPVRACVLMSLYKGGRYLRAQLESIAAQRDVQVHLIGRDDGSDDATAGIFRECCEELGLSHTLLIEENVGACRSFLLLMQAAPAGYDLYALSDQDDVWHPDKLIRASARLQPLENRPALYFCGQQITDEQLRVQLHSMEFKRIGFGNALVQNVVQGASAVMNRRGMALVQDVGFPDFVYMHDWWLYLLFSTLGELHYDHFAGMLYRQHGSNVVGVSAGRVSRWSGRLRRYLRQDGAFRWRQAEAFDQTVGERLASGDRLLLSRFLRGRSSLSDRLRLVTADSVWMQSRIDDLVMKSTFLLGRA